MPTRCPQPTLARRLLTLTGCGLLLLAAIRCGRPLTPEQAAPPPGPSTAASAAPSAPAAPSTAMITLPEPTFRGWQPLLPMGNLAGWTVLRGHPQADDGLLDLRPGSLIERPLPCPYYLLCGEVRVVYGDAVRSSAAGLIATRLFLRDDRRLPAAVLDPVPPPHRPFEPTCLSGGPFEGYDVDSPDYFRPRENLLPVGEWRAFLLWVSADEVDFFIDDNLLFTSVSYGWTLRKIRLESEVSGRLQFRNLYYRDAEER